MDMDPMEARMLVLQHLVKDNLLMEMLEERAEQDGLPWCEATTGEDVTDANDGLLVVVKACQF